MRYTDEHIRVLKLLVALQVIGIKEHKYSMGLSLIGHVPPPPKNAIRLNTISTYAHYIEFVPYNKRSKDLD